MTTYTATQTAGGSSDVLQRPVGFFQKIMGILAANARMRAIASLSDYQLQKLGIDRRELFYFVVHGEHLPENRAGRKSPQG